MPDFHLRFDIVEALRERLQFQAFAPFVVALHSGEKLPVEHWDFLTVTRSGRVIYDAGKGARMLNPALIASLDFPPPAE